MARVLGLSECEFEIAVSLLLDGPKTMGELAAASDISKSTATVLVDRLESLAYVDRRRSSSDRRRRHVEITEHGKTVLSSVFADLAGQVHAVAAAHLDDADRFVVDKFLHDVREVYDRQVLHLLDTAGTAVLRADIQAEENPA